MLRLFFVNLDDSRVVFLSQIPSHIQVQLVRRAPKLLRFCEHTFWGGLRHISFHKLVSHNYFTRISQASISQLKLSVRAASHNERVIVC